MQSGYVNPYATPQSVAAQSVDVRATFIRRTYSHLAIAIGVFAALEALLFQIPAARSLAATMMASRMSWFVVLAVYMAVSYLAEKWANSATSLKTQYMGLGLFILAEAIIFLPLLLLADRLAATNGGVIGQAAVLTLLLAAGLTVIAFTSKKDFSFLGGFLKIGFFVALGLIGASLFFNFNLGWIFAAAMILFAGGSILYTTSNIIHHYRTDQYVAASLGLFAGIALMFWYMIQILLSFSSRD